MNEAAEEALRKINGIMLENACSSLASSTPFFHYSKSNSSGVAVFRFTTDLIDSVFPKKKGKDGPWKNGCGAMYEIHNNVSGLTIRLMVSSLCFKAFDTKRIEPILHDGNLIQDENGLVCLAKWKIEDLYPKEQTSVSITRFVEEMLPEYEGHLLSWYQENESIFKEGTVTHVELDKYERNPKARAVCLAAHGSSCLICGFDFGKVYGPELEGRIEVHHIVPISSFEGEHEVDPIKDLIPVCPNCHLALHSKPNGVYMPDEIRAMLNKPKE